MKVIVGIIYLITCSESEKKYIGQTVNYKTKNGKLYRYGIKNRLVEHFGASRRNRTTPLAKAIRKYGCDAFSIEELERCELENTDSRESFYIKKYNTIKPNGYNVQESSQKSGGIFTEGEVLEAEIKGIKEDGHICQMRVMLKIVGREKRKRVMIGKSYKTFEERLCRAEEICEELNVKKIIYHSSLYTKDELWWPYKEKIEKLSKLDVRSFRMTKNNNLVTITIRINKPGKVIKTITFGGKTIDIKEALKTATTVAEKLKEIYQLNYSIDERLSIISQQQAAAEN